jgi:hypothetical protein
LKEEDNEAYSHPAWRDISIWIDGYDDIFSDFDPRPYSDRNISDDFLYEVKRVARESDFIVSELKLLIPGKSRNPETEDMIVKKLRRHFRKSYMHFSQSLRNEKKRGILLLAAGSFMLFTATYFSFMSFSKIYIHALFVILEPAGWFTSWTGLEAIFFTPKTRKQELDFYSGS